MHHRSLQIKELANAPYMIVRKLYRRIRLALSTSALINSLPNELLQHIFVLCVHLEVGDEDSSLYHRHTLNPNAPPWSLTLVCRRWYSLAVSFPGLWATLVAPYRAPNKLQEHLIRIHISRSAKCALDVYLRQASSRARETWPDFISEISHRCRRLDLWHAWDVELPSTVRSFPQLEVLRCPANLIHSDLQPLHETLPRLHTLSIQPSSPPGPPLSSLSIPLMLTSLTLAGFEYASILSFLHSTKSRLRLLDLRYISHKSESEPPPKPISFPQLEHLLLRNVSDAVVCATECPRLKGLTVSEKMPDNLRKTTFHLTITSANLPVNNSHAFLISHIRPANELVSLRLDASESSSSVNSGLFETERLFEALSDPTICPQLAYISIDYLPFYPRTLNQIKAFVRLARLRTPTLSYAVCVSVDTSTGKAWSELAASDGVTVAGVLEEMEDLRALYPRLDLRVERMTWREYIQRPCGL